MSSDEFFLANPEAYAEAEPILDKDDEFLAFWEDLTHDFENFETNDHPSPTPSQESHKLTPMEQYLESLHCAGTVKEISKNLSKKLGVVKSTMKPISNYFTKKVFANMKKMCPFPVFDKSDAMLYLPSTMAKLANSGDIEKFTTLLRTHSDKNAKVILCNKTNLEMPVSKFLELVELVDDLYPDSMNCMHSTKVINNKIVAVMYYKYTDAPEIYEHTESMVTDPLFRTFFVGSRKEIVQRALQLHEKSETLQKDINMLIDMQEELQMYGKSDLVMTFDAVSKKIMTYEYYSTATSVSHNGVQYNL
eukprot:CAMPEP_0184973404 /NCGR_PEP_ID=MMETSP1098-20130426/5201_1 /TAXON_ID=89044 /ORGANISM="Spumella elongata, Strain CCAP 955/1" /LENGTH=304 /DNA_ID=CAMNT_0027495857 /DNA_START=95 /DNA_END=1009 /DNA_ORIENTATION=-